MVGQQHTGVTGVLSGNPVDLRQNTQCPKGNILQVSDRSCYDIQAGFVHEGFIRNVILLLAGLLSTHPLSQHSFNITLKEYWGTIGYHSKAWRMKE
jgi:hypothetical protein